MPAPRPCGAAQRTRAAARRKRGPPPGLAPSVAVAKELMVVDGKFASRPRVPLWRRGATDGATPPTLRRAGGHLFGDGGRYVAIGFAAGGADAAGAIPKLPANLFLLKNAALLGSGLREWQVKDRKGAAAMGDEVVRLWHALPPLGEVRACGTTGASAPPPRS
eukprot:gene11792-168_t